MMGVCLRTVASLFVILSLLPVTVAMAGDVQTLTQKEIVDIATGAYIYGYSLITADVTKYQQSNVSKAELRASPLGIFKNLDRYPPASFRGVSAANADTLYSVTWLDLSEPQVLSHPEIKGRFFTFELFDFWMVVQDSVGTNTSGDKAMAYLLTRSDWKGTVPTGMTHITFPTRFMGILGRTYAMDTPEDMDTVRKLQAEYKIEPLSAYGKPYTYQAPPLQKSGYSMTDSPQKVIAAMGVAGYFDRLCELMATDAPPPAEDAPILASMAKLGIVPGRKFDIGQFSPQIQKVLSEVPESALRKMVEKWESLGRNVNGWRVTVDGGRYGTDYLLRAAWAARAWPSQLPEVSVYPNTYVDSDGNKLNGQNKYTLTFQKGRFPPINPQAFWSITMYIADQDGLWFNSNPLNRLNIQYPRDEKTLRYNPDGSLTLYFQNESPGKEKESNWLPAPKGDFNIMLRLYWPTKSQPSILDGSWDPPAVERVK